MSFSKIYSGVTGILLVLVCLVFVNLSVGEQRMCGHKLRNVLEMMCPNGFNSYKSKRGSPSIDEDFSNENTEEDFNFGLSLDMMPFLTSMENSGVAQIRRRRHGIAHECCDKPCKTSEVLAYCRN